MSDISVENKKSKHYHKIKKNRSLFTGKNVFKVMKAVAKHNTL